ncbi:hypothetical protein CN384_06050 [Bacillus thuringiensis]|uniref:hypothetical protein n=1 Tax=Bacillus thuringiensis TaxID=1428 RepID=UPI000BF956BD|nr:hypothetical protein [Bacillus thuringiensis]PFA29301.1 hypothetical protein CN384_06050 [Bacillus thuringiensis]
MVDLIHLLSKSEHASVYKIHSEISNWDGVHVIVRKDNGYTTVHIEGTVLPKTSNIKSKEKYKGGNTLSLIGAVTNARYEYLYSKKEYTVIYSSSSQITA